MSEGKCRYCDSALPEKYGTDTCPNCAEWLRARRGEETVMTDYTWDGGTLQIDEVQRELNCTHFVAEAVLDHFGAKLPSGRRCISQREFRFRQINGDIADFLSGSKIPTASRIEAAIKLLEDKGYKVIKGN